MSPASSWARKSSALSATIIPLKTGSRSNSTAWPVSSFVSSFSMAVAESAAGKKKYAIYEKGSGEVLFTGAVKDQKPGQKGEPTGPKFLGGPALDETGSAAGLTRKPDVTARPSRRRNRRSRARRSLPSGW